jgi:hypothetical protein
VAETALSAPVKRFLEGLGFAVKGEIDGCDILAIRAGDPPLLVIAELKLALTFELVLQAVDRLTAADEVWLAVPQTRKGRDRDRRAHRLCRLLGVGLLTVNLRTGHVEPECAPGPYRPRLDKAWRSKLIREFERRRGDPMEGGHTRRPIMTAYRQTSLALAAALRDGKLRPRDLKHVTPDAGAILLRNVYAWFERIAPGLYGLTPLGAQEVAQFLAREDPAANAGGPDGIQGSDR